jgi:hypothetical protein
MSSTDGNFYSKKSQIDGAIISPEFTMEQINAKLIPAGSMVQMYDDAIFYLHLYNSLYIAFIKYNDGKFNNVNEFTSVIDNLKIKIDNTITRSAGAAADTDTVGVLNKRDSDFLFTFYALKCSSYQYTTTSGIARATTTIDSTAPASYSPSASILIIPDADISKRLIYKKNSLSEINYTLINNANNYITAVEEYKLLYKKIPGIYTRSLTFPTSEEATYHILISNLNTGGAPISPETYQEVVGVSTLKTLIKQFIFSTSDLSTSVGTYPDFSGGGSFSYKMQYSQNTIGKSPTTYGSLAELKNGLVKRIYTGNNASSAKISTYPTANSDITAGVHILTSDLDNSGSPKSGITMNFTANQITTITDLENALRPYIYDSSTNLAVSTFPVAGDFTSKTYYIKYSTVSDVSLSSFGTQMNLENELLLRIYTKSADTYPAHTPSYTYGTSYNPGGGIISTTTTTFTPNKNSHYNEYITSGDSLVTKYTTHLPMLLNTETKNSTATFVTDTNPASLYGIEFSKTLLGTFAIPNDINDEKIDITYDLTYRQDRLKATIKQILNNNVETMMGYLLYNKIIYNIVLYNIEIQYSIRTNYINSTVNANKGVLNYISANTANIITPIRTKINNMKANIESLKENLFKQDESDYVQKKYKYLDKYDELQSMEKDYNKIHNALNVSVKDYNKYIKNFTSIKKYANYIIIFLIILIIITVIITILTNITEQFKNSYYIITLIILLIITYLFYNRFNHVNLYERFSLTAPYVLTASSASSSSLALTIEKDNYAHFSNNIADQLTQYNNEYKTIISDLKINIYTIDNKIFSTGTDNYLYKLYMEKKNLNEANRLKKVSLTNLIEGMKKQILYLFNIILLLSCLTIILLLGLMLHSTYPFLIIYILILCSILVIITVIYFIFAIIQPTRMVANKNYWANNRPSENILSKL